MGMVPYDVDIVEKLIKNKDRSLCSIAELGNQRLYYRDGRLTTSKKYFESTGVKHTSIDYNGKDGALQLDLTEDIPSKLLNMFDVVTDFGTSEHVTNQYMCWKNMHNLCKEGGMFIHAIPQTQNYPGHGLYKYTLEFFKDLAASRGHCGRRLRFWHGSSCW